MCIVQVILNWHDVTCLENLGDSVCGSLGNNCTDRVKVDVADLRNGRLSNIFFKNVGINLMLNCSYLDGDCQCKASCFEIVYGQILSESPLWKAGLQKYNISLNRSDRYSFFKSLQNVQHFVIGKIYTNKVNYANTAHVSLHY